MLYIPLRQTLYTEDCEEHDPDRPGSNSLDHSRRLSVLSHHCHFSEIRLSKGFADLLG